MTYINVQYNVHENKNNMLKYFNFTEGDIERQLTLCLMGVMVMFLVPFGIYRLVSGDIAHFVIDMVMAAIGAFVFLQSWRHKKSKWLSYLSTLAFVSVTTTLIYLKGMEMIFWAFPTMIGVYFLLPSSPAVLLNSAFVVLITMVYFDSLTLKDFTNIYPSFLLVCIFGYISSKRSEAQNDRLLKLATVDALTEVYNRRSFEAKLAEVLEHNKRGATSVCLLLLDLDLFKKINDNYGHKRGDKVLFDFAQRVKLMIRTTDYLYRFGGEEFAIITTNSKLENAIAFAENIRETIENTPSLSELNVTVSIGVSQIKSSDDADSWFRRADKALYQSKVNGRNRVSPEGKGIKGVRNISKEIDPTLTEAEAIIEKITQKKKVKQQAYHQDSKPLS